VYFSVWPEDSGLERLVSDPCTEKMAHIDHTVRAQAIALDTVAILDRGSYVNSLGEIVDITEKLNAAVINSVHYSAEHEFPETPRTQGRFLQTVYKLRSDTTLAAAEDLVNNSLVEHVAALNFASAQIPGGGFMRGALAQEEAIARSSGLYPCLARFEDIPGMIYQVNRGLEGMYRGFYTSNALFSPRVPVIRQDDFAAELLNEPFQCSFITMPAPNAGSVRVRIDKALTNNQHMRLQNTINEIKSYLNEILYDRIDRVLAIACENGCDALVLGAFGCGVFRNDSFIVAEIFHKLLTEKYKTCFQEVQFAIYVPNGKVCEDWNYCAFRETFQGDLSIDTLNLK